MDRRLNACAAVLVAAGLLAGCASTAAKKTASVAKPATSAMPAQPKGNADKGYRQVNRNGEVVYCKRELLTGSRTNSTETCLTAVQLEKLRNSNEQMLRNLQDMQNTRPLNDGFNNVMSQGGRAGGQ